MKNHFMKTFKRYFKLGRFAGGRNVHLEWFAGKLADFDNNDLLIDKICKCLIMKNGVRKTTDRNRNLSVYRAILESEDIRFNSAIRVLDIGASLGIDALEHRDLIHRKVDIMSYTLGDYYQYIYYDKQNGIIYDHEGNITQIKKDKYFVNIYFEDKKWYDRVIHFIPKRKVNRILAEYKGCEFIREKLIEIPLIHPAVIRSRCFIIRQMNVFEEIKEKYDLIICMHLLQKRYFTDREISQGIRNLRRALTKNGKLIIGVAEKFQVVSADHDVSYE